MTKYKNLLEKSKVFFSQYGEGSEINDLDFNSPDIYVEKRLKEEFREFFMERVEDLELLEEFLNDFESE